VAGATEPGRAGRRARHKRRRGRSWWIELPILLVFALVLALLIKTFVVQAFFIPSSSMEDTLDIGDKVLVNKLVYDFRPIHRGDIVVFNGDGSWNPVPVKAKPPLVRLWDAIAGLFGSPPGAHDYIKRVIGIPGDHVACCDAHGHVTVNGVPLQEKSYLYPGNTPSSTQFSVTVPPGHLWVMGDHRDVSADSRSHMSDPNHGTVPQDMVVGRAFLIIAPVSRWRVLPIPSTFERPALVKSASHPAAGGVSPAADVLALAGAPGGPLAVGLVGALPLTWLQRRVRRRLGGFARRRFALARFGRRARRSRATPSSHTAAERRGPGRAWWTGPFGRGRW
jgi:signal peptidase I